ncbi:predicted protein [Nematostella vectensis]|uniref:Uncharacterized protein n=1 Tax=Nematostella vectensis TaxID=45351 RepID=A7SZK4_NEMVE|nr:predicted protein [Nematostella vectensis]|eukprot:XP_001622956.1 predicted protein [Nematostella vectensis]
MPELEIGHRENSDSEVGRKKARITAWPPTTTTPCSRTLELQGVIEVLKEYDSIAGTDINCCICAKYEVKIVNNNRYMGGLTFSESSYAQFYGDRVVFLEAIHFDVLYNNMEFDAKVVCTLVFPKGITLVLRYVWNFKMNIFREHQKFSAGHAVLHAKNY